MFAAGFSLALENAVGRLERLQRAFPAGKESRVRLLQEQGKGARWIFTHEMLAAFWAGLPIPPELAVVPRKRIWSGQLKPELVREVLERYQPELILLGKRHREEYQLEDYLAAHYTPVATAPELLRRR